MSLVKYLSRCHDSEPDVIRQRELEAIQKELDDKVQARKDYQKWYQANYARQTPERLEKQKLYQREYRLRFKEELGYDV